MNRLVIDNEYTKNMFQQCINATGIEFTKAYGETTDTVLEYYRLTDTLTVRIVYRYPDFKEDKGQVTVGLYQDDIELDGAYTINSYNELLGEYEFDMTDIATGEGEVYKLNISEKILDNVK